MKRNFTQYSVLDFAEEDSFIRWVRLRDPEAAAFWEQWAEQHPEKQSEIEEAKRLVLALTVREEEPSSAQLNVLWASIDQATATEGKAPAVPQAARRIALRPWMAYALAAAASVALIVVMLFKNPDKQLVVQNGEQIAFALPDGSSVKANAGSTLTYNPRQWKKERRLQLNGEAFFTVEKGKPFIVETPEGQVEVLGTRFNVQARTGTFRVDCLSGKVRVTTLAQSVQILTAGLSTMQEESGALSAPLKLDTLAIASWRDGRFYFQDAPLKQVFEELERQYDVRIQGSPDIMRRRTTTFFELGNLDSALYKVCWPMQLEAQKKGRVIYIK